MKSTLHGYPSKLGSVNHLKTNDKYTEKFGAQDKVCSYINPYYFKISKNAFNRILALILSKDVEKNSLPNDI